VFRCLARQELIRRSGNLVQRGARPAAEARTRRGPRSDPGCAVDSRAEAHARVEAEGQRFVRPRPLEARSSSTAVPKRCRGTELSGCRGGRSCFEHLENPQWPVAISSHRSGMRARCRAARPPKRLAGSTGAVRASPRRCGSGCRLPPAEAGRRSASTGSGSEESGGLSTVGMSGFREGSGQTDTVTEEPASR